MRCLDSYMSIEDRQVLLSHAASSVNEVYTHPNFDLAKQYVDKIPMYGNEDSV